MAAALALTLAAVPALADTQGLVDARLLPGWVGADGQRYAAVALTLAPGWKTYWRAPGEAGIAPEFDWHGVTAPEPLWPAPEVIVSQGQRTLGYHDRLLLPLRGGEAGPLTLTLRFGLCDDLCVPAEVTLQAPAAGAAPDGRILAALDAAPQPGPALPRCTVSDIADGVRLTATLPHEGPPPAAALELDGLPEVWVSTPEVRADAGTLAVTADFVEPAGKPFALPTDALRLTLIDTAGGASETRGCAGG